MYNIQNDDVKKEGCAKYEKMLMKARERTLNDYERILSIDIRSTIQELLKDNQTIRILDIGCGTGKAMRELQDLFTLTRLEVIGLDLYAYEDSHLKNIQLGSIENEPKDLGSFDLIISTHAFRYVQNKLQAFKHTAQLLKETGEAYVNLASDLIHCHKDPRIMPDSTKEDTTRMNNLLTEIGYEPCIQYDLSKQHRPRYGFPDRMEYGRFRIKPEAQDIPMPQLIETWAPTDNNSFCINYVSNEC